MSRPGIIPEVPQFPMMPIPIHPVNIVSSLQGNSAPMMTMTPPSVSPAPNFLTPGLLSTPTPSPTPQTKKCIFDPKVKGVQHTMVLDQILDAIKTKSRKDYDIDLTALAIALPTLNLRMRKVAMEIIYEFHTANPSRVQVMGRVSDIPYRGSYNKSEDYLEFNLVNLPDTLIIVLYEFVLLTKIHQTTPSH